MGYVGYKPASVPLTSADITDGIIVNADINASAAIALTKLASTGTLTLDNIQFPATQVTSSNANNLDDYEEGTFTPTLIDGSNNQPTSYNSQVGTYTKVGNLVVVNIYVYILTLGATITGQVYIGGLPFTSKNITNGYIAACVPYWDKFTSTFVLLGGVLFPNASKINLNKLAAAATGVSAMQASDWKSGADYIITCSYYTT